MGGILESEPISIEVAKRKGVAISRTLADLMGAPVLTFLEALGP
jgi:hypothetical protein